MDIEVSAEKHGITKADIWFALDNIPAGEPLRVIHADILRPNHYHFLERGDRND